MAGGLLSPEDESGDAHLFTQELAKLAQAKGVAFHFGETVARLEAERKHVVAVITDRGRYTPDAVVIAAGSYSPQLVKPLGLALPIYPAKGYSITVDIADSTA